MQANPRGSVSISQRTSEGVARILRTDIFSGRLNPGDPLPERQLAEQLGVSRTPVREALFTLQSEGLVDLSPNRGATVRRVTEHDIEQVYSLRMVLESYAAREAAIARRPEDLDELEAAHAKLMRISGRSAVSVSDQALADLAFHRVISQATGSQLLHTIMGQVLAYTVSYRSNESYPKERAALALSEHRAILDAIHEQDADRAEQEMHDHVVSASKFALQHFSDLAPHLSR